MSEAILDKYRVCKVILSHTQLCKEGESGKKRGGGYVREKMPRAQREEGGGHGGRTEEKGSRRN